MHRFFLRTTAGVGAVVELGESDSHHAARVLRLQVGDAVEVLDGAGRRLGARVLEVSKRATRLAVQVEHRVPAPARVELAPSLLKGKAMDFLVQKVTELGVARLCPLSTERAVVQIRDDEAAEKVLDWTRTAMEACKQCGNPWLPTIETPRSLSDFLSETSPGILIVASLRPDALVARHLFAHWEPGSVDRVTLVLGPEGDFSPDEEDALRRAGAMPMNLGPLVLRAETAAIAGLALIQHELGLLRA